MSFGDESGDNEFDILVVEDHRAPLQTISERLIAKNIPRSRASDDRCIIHECGEFDIRLVHTYRDAAAIIESSQNLVALFTDWHLDAPQDMILGRGANGLHLVSLAVARSPLTEIFLISHNSRYMAARAAQINRAKYGPTGVPNRVVPLGKHPTAIVAHTLGIIAGNPLRLPVRRRDVVSDIAFFHDHRFYYDQSSILSIH